MHIMTRILLTNIMNHIDKCLLPAMKICLLPLIKEALRSVCPPTIINVSFLLTKGEKFARLPKNFPFSNFIAFLLSKRFLFYFIFLIR